MSRPIAAAWFSAWLFARGHALLGAGVPDSTERSRRLLDARYHGYALDNDRPECLRAVAAQLRSNTWKGEYRAMERNRGKQAGRVMIISILSLASIYELAAEEA